MRVFLCILNNNLYKGTFQACLDYHTYFLGHDKAHEYNKIEVGDVIILCSEQSLYAYGQVTDKFDMRNGVAPEYKHFLKNKSLVPEENLVCWPHALRVSEWYGREGFEPIRRGKVSEWVDTHANMSLVKPADLSDKLLSVLEQLNPYTDLFDEIKSLVKTGK